MIKTLKNKVLIISVFLLLVCVGVLVNYTFFKPTKLNYFVASKIYKAPANSAFTDDNFYKCVVDAYNKENGTSVAYTSNLTDEQLETITNLGCTLKEITNTTGLEKLTNLEELYLSGNNLTELDVSNNTELRYLHAYKNQISSLKLNNKLGTLYIYENQLSELDISNTNIFILDAHENQLTKLNLNNCVRDLVVHHNKLTKLNLGNNTYLKKIYAIDNQLTQLDVTGTPNLESLNVDNNLLTEIDVSNNKKIKDLSLSNNNLSEIDLSNNKELTSLGLSNNQMTEIDLSNNNILHYLYLSNNKLRKLNINGLTNLVYLYSENNELTTLDVSDNVLLEQMNLTDNQLTEIDITKNVNLKNFEAHNNKITELDVSNNTVLKKLSLNYNQLDVIDLSKNLLLEELYIYDNQLKKLDVSKNENLKNLNIGSNPFVKNIALYIGDVSPLDVPIILPQTLLENNYSQYSWFWTIASGKSKVSLISDEITANESGQVVLEGDFKNTPYVAFESKIIINIIEATSDKYEINAEEGYIYTKTDIDSETILSNINLNYGQAWVEDNKLLIKYEGELVKEFDIVNVSSEVYKITDDYIYYEDGDLISSNIKLTNATMTTVDNSEHNYKMRIKYNDKEIDLLDYVTYWSRDYDLTKDYIFDDGTFNLDLIKTMNLTKEIVDNKLIIRYKDEVFESIDIVKVESEEYDLSKDYIYTGSNNINLNDINVINGFSELDSDNLIIKYNDEILKQYSIYNINFEQLNIRNKRIVILDETTYEQFISNITPNGVTYKIYDGEEVVTTGNITPGMKLKVYIGEEIIDTYEITNEYLEISDNLNVNETTSMIEDLTVGQTVENIKENIDTTGIVKIVNQENTEVIDDIIGTGYKVIIELSKETIEYTLVVSGDITGDGEIKMSDVMKVATQMIEEDTIVGDCYLKAADVTGDGKIRMSDVMKLANMILEGEI